ncbi:hypothetical protein SAMN05444365_103264 [Micromonospora pattaloongensis]|uniref:Tryptophan-associated transmembrane protein (Trp_oprn_chp) n=1 Tax=Micromonospora pattaloongensis TaxID=405436 RepID=A0A1H3M7A4_9ACTN|nr:hypothetical protein SAMN05444365_103264 [Micromonospora pattaloongensis]
MRHLWSLLAGIVVAPITWLLIALGQGGSSRTVAGWVEDGRYDTARLIEPAAYLVAAGILLGLLGTLRVSPLGPLAAGLLLVGAYAGMFAAPFVIHDSLPDNEQLLGRPLPLELPLDNGTLFLLGALLLMATFSAQRWRRWPGTSAAADGATIAARPAGAGAPGPDGDGEAPTVATEPVDGAGDAEPGAGPGAGAGDAEPGAGVGDAERGGAATPEPGAPPAAGAPPAVVPSPRDGDATERANALPRRRDSQSPWSTPPGATKQETTTD